MAESMHQLVNVKSEPMTMETLLVNLVTQKNVQNVPKALIIVRNVKEI